MPIARLLRWLAQVLLVAACAAASAQDRFPLKPIQVVVPFSPGTATDILARMFAPKLAERLGQSVVVQNRIGAGGTLGTQAVASAPADGYTLLMVNSSHAINPTLYTRLPYDSQRDFAGIALVAESAYLIVASPHAGVKNLKELVGAAKQKPGTIHYASAGLGTATHLAGAYFTQLAGIDLVHVPYKNTADYVADLLAGRIEITFAPTAFLLQHIKDGKLLALGVSTPEPMRSPLEVPSVREAAGIGYEFIAWFGLLAPAKTPPAVMETLSKSMRAIVESGVLSEDYRKIGMSARNVALTDFDTYVKRDMDLLGPFVKASGARAD